MIGPVESALPLLGFAIHGDLGPLTIYTSSRGRKVFFLKAPPLTPPTLRQRGQRLRFSAAAAAWRLLSPAARDLWKRAAKLAHLRIGGYALWTAYQLAHNPRWLSTIERQTGTQLPTA